MVKDPKRDIGHRTYAYYGLPTEGTKRAGWGTEDSPPALRVGKRCGLTKAPTFGGAIERIVRDVKLARRVQTVELVQDWNEAVICWGPRSKIQTSRFMDGQGAIAKNNANALGTLRSTSRIEGKALVAMAEELSEDV